MRIENATSLAGRLARLTLVASLLAMGASAVCAQGLDDSYKGPPQGGGLDGQMRGLETPPAAPLPGGGAAAPGGGLQGRQTQGTIAPIPIAIPFFLGPDPKLAADISDVVSADLERSGLFIPLDRASFLEQVRDVNAAPRFPDWRSIRADALVVGNVGQAADGRIVAEFRLWDVTTGRQLAGQRFATSAQNWRRVGHIIADQVYEQLTGEKGYFDTRVVFVDETGPKDRRVKRLAIMDQDGKNIRLLSKGQELVLTPRFSPTNQEITFMSYAGEQPRVFLMNLESGQREIVGDFPGMTFAPRFSPDGQRVVMSLQSEGNSSIYELDLRSRQKRRLTQGTSIDTSPSYSPDGRQVVFESDRDGNQADLRDERGRLEPASNQHGRWPLLDAGVVAARRLRRVYQATRRALPHRRHAPRRLRRAHPDRGIPQRGSDLGAERACADVLPRIAR